MNRRGKRGKKRSLSQVQMDKDKEIDLPEYPPMGRVMKYQEPLEETRIKEMAVGYQNAVNIQRRSVFYFEEKQQVHVERYSDRNVKQKTQTKFPQFVTTLKGVREYIPPELQKAMTRGTPLAKLVEKYHAIKERNPDVKRCHTLADLMKMEEKKEKEKKEQEEKERKKKKKKKEKKEKKEEEEKKKKKGDGNTLKQKVKAIFESDSSEDSDSDEENELQLDSDNDEKKKKNQSDDDEDFNDYAQDYDVEVEEDDADS